MRLCTQIANSFRTPRLGLVGLLLLIVVQTGCSGKNPDDYTFTPPLSSGDLTTTSTVSAGVTPFIAFINLNSVNISILKSIGYIIQPKPNTVSQPVSVTFSAAYLTQNSYSFPGTSSVKLPIFGLYANYANLVDITLNFIDGTSRKLSTATVTTGIYSGGSTLYLTPIVHTARSSSDSLGFNFFYMKNNVGTPVIVDTDGNVRWLGTGSVASYNSAWYQNGFVVGASGSAITRYELDGRIATSYLSNPNYLNFHHNIDFGPVGLLGEFDQSSKVESTLAEFNPTSGTVLHEWDIAKIISDYMTVNGDDPTLFVRPGVDWFHNNASTYDPKDNSLILSSRENFLIKINYATSQIVWIFGDPTKYWYTFPSLKAKALTLTTGLYPIGQHAVSITPQGYLQVFNNGYQSNKQPPTAPAGDWRNYSTVSSFSIDEVTHTVTEISEFDNGKSILSNVCSSAYAETDGSILINYSVAQSGSANAGAGSNPLTTGTTARLVGLNPLKIISFDFEYPSPVACSTSFNATVIRLESLTFQ